MISQGGHKPWSRDSTEVGTAMLLPQGWRWGGSEASMNGPQHVPLESWVAQDSPREDEKEKLELSFLSIFTKKKKLTFISIWIKSKSYTS